jgi:hypothetical protein
VLAAASAAQQAVTAVGRASSLPYNSYLSPVVDYHGVGHRHLTTPRLLVRPQLNGGTLDRRGRNLDAALKSGLSRTREGIPKMLP